MVHASNKPQLWILIAVREKARARAHTMGIRRGIFRTRGIWGWGGGLWGEKKRNGLVGIFRAPAPSPHKKYLIEFFRWKIRSNLSVTCLNQLHEIFIVYFFYDLFHFFFWPILKTDKCLKDKLSTVFKPQPNLETILKTNIFIAKPIIILICNVYISFWLSVNTCSSRLQMCVCVCLLCGRVCSFAWVYACV